MSDLSTALEGYLGLRRSLGYKLERAGELLADFVAYLHRAGVHTITTELAIAWAALPPNAESAWRAQRLGVVRGFARYKFLFQEPEPDPACGAELEEALEDVADGLGDRLIEVQEYLPVGLAPYQTDRQAPTQLAALCLVADAVVQASPQHVQLGL